MNISEHPLTEATVISLALACVCPEDKVERLKAAAEESKDLLLIEVEKFLLKESERVLENEAEFERLFQKHINKTKAKKFLEETAP